ncbi:hypothetical protein K3G39_03490 [Pontibacter sp. HSC-14F20]|uniref:hypothetical protein n=1 Tax=Pontibacter sp. HSC-14F20 TaxID=2864136 RepID=UPI001C73A0E7|nr:hypothetical protein [Pontibacter sp. HSC-14F20]MBX0332291.1 hypothetical protein [Pontibacter sp. HSC-14F20]
MSFFYLLPGKTFAMVQKSTKRKWHGTACWYNVCVLGQPLSRQGMVEHEPDRAFIVSELSENMTIQATLLEFQF